MGVLPCNDECGVISIKAEPETDIQIKEEEIPEPIIFPEIKDEPNEVSYLSVYHQYINMARLFSCLLLWSAHLNNRSVDIKISVLSWVV
jgi:hypothetical protein